jgi:hypothetical protein
LYGHITIATRFLLGLAKGYLQDERITKGVLMKKLANRIVLLLVLGVMTSGLAFGKTTRKEVTFNHPVVVNGTLVKAGSYNVAFDDETGELTIAKGKKVVVSTPARLEKLPEKSKASYVYRAETDGATVTAVLLSVTLKDGNQATIGTEGEGKGGAQ